MNSKELIDYILDRTKNISIALEHEDNNIFILHCVGYDSQFHFQIDKAMINENTYLRYVVGNIINCLGKITYEGRKNNERAL